MPSRISIDGLSVWLERLIVIAVQLLLLIVIVLATGTLVMLAYRGISEERVLNIQSIAELQDHLQDAFGGVLLVLLGLELLETMRTYFVEHRVRLEVILIVAIIAVSRHVITIDYEHADGLWLVGVASLVLGLGAAYYLVKRQPAAGVSSS